VATDAEARARARDATMSIILLIWLVYATAAVIQLFTSGAKVLDSLPPYWWWGVPLAPYSALYTPWKSSTTAPAEAPPAAPEPEPPQPPAPGAA
jgi:hypothetical protein